MYTKDKTHRITLRLNDAQFSHIMSSCEMLGVSPSDFLRMVVNASMWGGKQGADIAAKYGVKEDGIGRENDKADSNNLL